MPIVSGNQSADIKIQIAAEMDKASAKAVQDAVAKMSDAGRKATEAEIRAERELKAVQDARLKSQQMAMKAQIDAQNKYRAGLMKTREEAEKLQQVSQKALMGGAAILAPFIASVVKFTTTAAKSDPVAKQYQASMKSLEESTNKIGRVTTDILNPALKVTAEIMADIARTVEKNPALIEGVVGVGGALIALGTIGTVVSQIKMITSTLMLLSGAGSVATAAGGTVAGGALAGGGIAAAATAAAPYIIAALLAAGVIYMVWKAVENAKPVSDQVRANFDPANQFGGQPFGPSFKTGMAGKVFGPPRPGYGEYGGKIGPGIVSESGNAIARAVAEKEAARLEAEKAAAEKRLEATKQFEAKRADIEKSQAEITRSFLKADKEAHQDYYNQRMDIARAAGIEASRAEEDHQRNIAKIQRDSDNRISDMVQERDALGIVHEKRNAETQRSDAEEQYRIEVSRRNQDMAERLRIMDREFAAVNERRLIEYNYAISLKQAEVTAAQMAFDAITAGAAAMVANVNALMAGVGGREQAPGTRKPGERYASGGDVLRTGPAIVHAGELVINRSNRQMAENLIGGNLSQSGLLDALRGGGRATINNNFGGTVTIQQVAALVDMSAKSIMQSINRSIQAA